MHIAIIGNGISGITTARWIRKLSEHKIKVIYSETEHFFSRTALMYIYMGHMRYNETKPYEDNFWDKNKIDLVQDHVENIDFDSKSMSMRNGTDIKYDKLVLALGSATNKFGWPGQDLNRVAGLYSYNDVENMERHTPSMKRAVIVGGGLIGIEMAEMFRSRDIPVTMLVRESSYWNNVLPAEESHMISRHIKEHHIDLRLSEELESIEDDGNGNACAVKMKNSGERMECEYVGLTAGVHPNVKWLKETMLNVEKGIIVDKHLETNIKDVYAIGDCAQLSEPRPGRKNIEAIWYAGRMMGETAAYNICGKSVDYDPGIWFNSAKFLDIEYQVYGDVPGTLHDYLSTLYWEHPEGDKAIRINYHTDNNKVAGFNLMGIRFRHEVCKKWIRDGTSLQEVLENLNLANFDPEFYKTYETLIRKSFSEQSGISYQVKSKRILDRVTAFLTS